MVDDDDEIQSEDETHSHLTNGGPSHFQMDEVFCARMRKAIEAGLESAPIGVVTTPGTQEPQIRPNKAFAATLLDCRNGLLVLRCATIEPESSPSPA